MGGNVAKSSRDIGCGGATGRGRWATSSPGRWPWSPAVGRGSAPRSPRLFAGEGAGVAVLDIDAASAQQVATALADELGVPTTAVRVDVGDAASVAAAARHVESELGGCDVLCANVGVQQFGAIDRLTEDDWQWVLNVNVLGAVRTVREFLPLLRAAIGLAPDRPHRVVERGRAERAHGGVPDEQVRGHGLRRDAAGGARRRGDRRHDPVPGRDDHPPPREQRGRPPGRARRPPAPATTTSTRCSPTPRWPRATW